MRVLPECRKAVREVKPPDGIISQIVHFMATIFECAAKVSFKSAFGLEGSSRAFAKIRLSSALSFII